MADKTDFSSATKVPMATTPSPLANTNFGPKADWPNATKVPQPAATREGPGAWHDTKKGTSDFSSSTKLPVTTGDPNKRVRPEANPPSFEKK